MNSKKRIEEVIGRLENYPCNMGCYLKVGEMLAAKGMKDSMIRVLKEGLSE